MLNLFAEIGRYLFFFLLKCIFFLGVVGEDIKVNRNYFLKFIQSTAIFCFFAVKLIQLAENHLCTELKENTEKLNKKLKIMVR